MSNLILKNDQLALYYRQFNNSINSNKHEVALRIYTFIVLAHWAEHLVQAFQIFILKWPRAQSLGLLGNWFPWLISSELLHYSYALLMLMGLWILRIGFVGRGKKWWMISFYIQFWHHFEHLLLQMQVLFKHNLLHSPVPMSVLQLFIPRVELHLFYNTVVFIPMALAMYYHLFPSNDELAHFKCNCAIKPHKWTK